MDVLLYGVFECLDVFKFIEIIHLRFDDAPETFNRSTINALTDTRHTLCEPIVLKLHLKDMTRVLKSSVRVEERCCVRILSHRFLKDLEHQLIIITTTDFIGYDTPIIQVDDGTEIKFLAGMMFLELRHVGDPCLIGSTGVEVSSQEVLGCDLWR